MTVQAECPSWCTDRHENGGRLNHIKIFSLDARCWVAAVYSEGARGIDDPRVVVSVHLAGQDAAQLAPREAMKLALILQARTTAPGVRRLASAMHRAGELLLPLVEPSGAE